MLVRRHKGKKKTTLEDVMPKPVFQPEQEEVENNEMVDNNEQEASKKKSKSKKDRK